MRHWRHLLFAAGLLWATPALAQQLLTGMTGAQCAAAGGTIRTWTNTAGTTPMVGECYVPPRLGGGGTTYRGGGGGNSSLGRAQGVLGALGNLLGALRDLAPDDEPGDDDDGEAAERQQIADMAQDANDRGIAATKAGDYDEALAEFELAAAHFERLGDDDNYDVVQRNVAVARGRQAEAEEAARREAARQVTPPATDTASSAPTREPFNCGPGPHPPDVVGCYDLGARPPAKGKPNKNSLRDELKKKLAEKNPPVRADETTAPNPAPAKAEPPGEPAPVAAPAPARPTDTAPPPGYRRDVLTESQCKTWGGRFFTPDGQTMPVCDYPASPAFTLQGTK